MLFKRTIGIKLYVCLGLLLVSHLCFSQDILISGQVTDQYELPLPGVNIIIIGTSIGTQTDLNGQYSLQVEEGQTLRISFVGFKAQEVLVINQTMINVVLLEDVTALEEIVITALGIAREKKSLGYATQEVSGEAVSTVKSQNFINSLSGKIAGLTIKPSGTLGGSTNVVVRGSSSIQGNNQALFVIDGVPINNDTGNSEQQEFGFGGYDYGNAASDINPDDIENINVLKGAAATALYGSRAANGVIIITTKKGSKRDGIGVTINSSLTIGTADKSTLPKYQKKYGAGYGPYYEGPGFGFGLYDVNGDGEDDLTTVFTEDASYGTAFDPNLLVYQWNSLYEGLDTYLQPTPWVAGENDPNYVWETSSTWINSVSLDGGSDTSTFRLGITNMTQDGNLPNSEIKRNTINFSGSHQFNDRLTASTSFAFTKTDGRGRYGTGYDGNNELIAFRQFWQVNVDLAEQERAYFALRENATWNPLDVEDTHPIYANNSYWTFYENYETDTRNRYFGNIALNYKINDWLTALGRFSFDTYSELREERTNVGSVNIPGYIRQNRKVAEYNYDFILTVNKEISEKLNLSGTLGFNLRRNEWNNDAARTTDGLLLGSLYTLSNSVGPVLTTEYDATKMVDGTYAQASLGYDNFAYLEGTFRTDRSSALPKANNRYYYWSITGSFVFQRFLKADWVSFGKLRANYGVVGNDTDPYRVFNTFNIINPPFNGGLATNQNALSNANLRPEEQRNWEIGLEVQFFKRRIGFDISYYNTKNIDQITSVPVSNSTGYESALLNAGTIQNKGWEIQLSASPFKSPDFDWDINLNWTKNKSLVLELADGINNLQLGFFQETTLNATPGQAYGTIRGTNLVYHENGQPIVDEFGYYLISDNGNEIIGDINPDWTAGIINSFRYKNFRLSFLIDIKKGGDLFSLDTYYGYTTGIYDFSAANNGLGNPIRDPITSDLDSGGVILPGVQVDGSPNTIRADASTFANPWGYFYGTHKQHIYDAGFVKLREASLTYNLGEKLISKLPFTAASFSIIGRNLWIIDKHVPYADPESGISAGNLQGIQVGAYPSIREIGASLKLEF